MTDNKIIVHIDDEDILELIPVYLERIRQELEMMQDAALRNDFETLRGLGHKIKGSGGGFGLDRVSEIGAKLELSAQAGDLTAVELEIGHLRDYLERVEVAGL